MAEVYPKPGTFLWERIKNEIKNSDCFVVLWTREGAKSQYVNQEIGCANVLEIPIVPIIKEGAKRVGVLEGFEYIPYDKRMNRRLFGRLSDLRREKEIRYSRKNNRLMYFAILMFLIEIIASVVIWVK